MVLRKKAPKKTEKRKLYHTFHWGFRPLFRRVRRNCRSEGFFLYCQLCLSSLSLFPESSCRPLLQRCLHLLPGKGKKNWRFEAKSHEWCWSPKCNNCPKCNKVLNVITFGPKCNKVLNVITFSPKCNKPPMQSFNSFSALLLWRTSTLRC